MGKTDILRICLYIVAFLLVISMDTCLGDPLLTWPIIGQTGVVKGTFGDLRSTQFHPGVDFHAPWGTHVRPVSGSGSEYIVEILPNESAGWNLVTRQNWVGSPDYKYTYAHVETHTPDGWHWWEENQYIANYWDSDDSAMTSLVIWPGGEDWKSHLHFGEKDTTDEWWECPPDGWCWRNPFWQNSAGVLTFNYTDNDPPNIVEITYGKCVGPNDTLNNKYYPRSGLPGDEDIDIIVYVNDRSSGWDQKVGIDSLDYAITTTESEPWYWNAFVCFHRVLPSDYDIDYVYARDNRWDDPDDDITIPNTVHSGNSSDHIDKMWYIVTNSNGLYSYANIYAWHTPDSECDRYVWIRAVDGAGNKGNCTVYYEKVHINKPGVKPQENQQVPRSFLLWQNYPNPFNPVTQIRYQLPRRERVEVTIFNLLGQKVRTLVDDWEPAGYHTACWDGRDEGGKEVAGGVFFCRMEAGRFSDVKKMLLLK